MDAKSIGNSIAKLRKKSGLTQSQLAQKLNISDKTVSRWENGLGYPEITQFPVLSELFGVTVDYLMTGKRKGITLAGNILADIVKNVDCYPKIGMLANIKELSRAVGGSVPNTAIDIAKIDRTIPLSAVGRIGDDEYGRYVVGQMNRYNINTEMVSVSETKPTSFSDVISQPSGERTFFHARGANAEFSPEHIDVSALNCQIFHIGYILLLDSFDKEDPEYGTVMARFLRDVQNQGIKTSVDVVSDSTADYKAKILPALKYCNYIILNEIESSMLSDLPPYDENGKLNPENIKKTMQFMASQGVKDKIIVHCKEAGFCYDVASGKFTAVPSLNIPSSEIKGSVGAGDAFCAGSLYGIYNNYDDQHILEFASSAAACNLFSDNSVDGMLNKNEIEKMAEKYGRKKL
ncbi:MAG: helix-turn-helix domain-containing protein [Ruminococcaceae bacterium]|nr:helix-turn-helix domain-containing protein [Oscillospiraceae bacterium]